MKIKAIKAEEIMNATREAKGFVGVTENQVVASVVESARNNGRLGDKVMMVIPPHYIHFPEWQRKLDTDRSDAIAKNYNSAKWEVPKVIYTNGKLYCIDGMHRIYGAYTGDIKFVVVELLDGITEIEAIDLFLSQGVDRRRISPEDNYRPSVKANKQAYITLRDELHKYNIQIKGDDEVENPIGTFTSINDGINTIKSDVDTFKNIINLIYRMGWFGESCTMSFSSKTFRPLKKLYGANKGCEAEMEKILMKHCKGTKYYTENIQGRPQFVIFDTLNKVIEDNKSKRTAISIYTA